MAFNQQDTIQSIDSLMKIDRSMISEQVRDLKNNKNSLECRKTLGSVARLLLTGEKLEHEEVNDHLLKGLFQMFSITDNVLSIRQITFWTIKDTLQWMVNQNSKKLMAGEYRSMFKGQLETGAKTRDKLLKPNAIRAFCRVCESSDAQTLAKAIDPLIVDPDSSIQSAALVSLYHSLPWGTSHVQPLQKQIEKTASQSRSSGTWAWPEYHALGLDYRTRSAKEMLAKDYITSGDGGFKRTQKLHGPPAKIFFCRFAAEIAKKGSYRAGAIELLKELLESFESIEYDPTVTGDKESFVLKRSMVALEAAKTICKMEDMDLTTLDAAVQKLVEMVNNSHYVVKFSAMRALCSVASSYPNVVRKYNDTIRKHMKNPNEDIGNIATKTLLKTADEADVDSFMKEVGSLMTSASNDFKVVMVEAVTALCLKFPNKHAALTKFLGDNLKDERSYEVKSAMVEGMFDLLKSIPETKEDVLRQLCEFIEDCEYPGLAVRVLHIVGSDGPNVRRPTLYIRHIYNRLVLDNALIRAAAVTALSKFGVGQKDPEVKHSVHVLLSRSLDDDDDEVRDRAALSLRLMDGEDESAPELIRNDSMFSLAELEDRLTMYVSADDREAFKAPFDLSVVPVVSREKARSETRTKKLLGNAPAPKARIADSKAVGRSGAETTGSPAAAAQKQYVKEMQAFPELVAHGNLLRSSPVVELTHSGLEYEVSAVKHIFREHVVFQYNITNTREGYVLVNVTVETECVPQDQSDLEEEFSIPIPELRERQSGICYVSFVKTDAAGEYLQQNLRFSNELRFTCKEIDSTTNEPLESGIEETWGTDEEIALTGADFVMPAYAGSFDNVWNQSYAEKPEPYIWETRSISSIQNAVTEVLSCLPLQPLDGTDVAPSKLTHRLNLYGKTVYGGKIAAELGFALVPNIPSKFTVRFSVKSDEKIIADLLWKVLAELFLEEPSRG